MIIIRKANKDDLQTVHDMAQVVFRHTYHDILSSEQMEYMMEMMYSLPNLNAQLDDGHHYYIAYEGDTGLADNAHANGYEAADSIEEYVRDGHSTACGRPCGYVSVQHQGHDQDGVEVFHLHKIYVMPQSQGSGVGMRLFQTVVGHVKTVTCGLFLTESGYVNENDSIHDKSSMKARIELNVNKHNPAVAFYKHIGMRIIHEEDYPIGNGFYKTDYIMALDL